MLDRVNDKGFRGSVEKSQKQLEREAIAHWIEGRVQAERLNIQQQAERGVQLAPLYSAIFESLATICRNPEVAQDVFEDWMKSVTAFIGRVRTQHPEAPYSQVYYQGVKDFVNSRPPLLDRMIQEIDRVSESAKVAQTGSSIRFHLSPEAMISQLYAAFVMHQRGQS